jgi:hypothetical protein
MTRRPQQSTEPFVWTPGAGSDAAALGRLRAAFPRPAAPMGEAWFMGSERLMFHNLMGDVSALPVADLFAPLMEITSGTSSFGPYDEWKEWCHYLLPRLIPRAHEQYVASLLEPLISAFITQYPVGVAVEPYQGFRRDALQTLGQCLMERHCWAEGRLVLGTMLHRHENTHVGLWAWFDASGDFTASMFFCSKYLTPDEIEPWLVSVLGITCPHWRAQVIVWFVGAHAMLTGGLPQISDLDTAQRPQMTWENSHCLTGSYSGDHSDDAAPPPPFLPAANRDAILRTLRQHLTQDRVLEWLLSIAAVDYLEVELAELPDRFCDLYLSGPG